MPKRVAVVTGAAGGLGTAIVAALVQADYAVIACVHHTPWPTTAWPHVSPCAMDLEMMERDALDATLAPLLHLYRYRVDLLVTAHGAAPALTPSLGVDTATFDRVYRTDVLGTLRIAQVVAPYMLAARQGSMVFVSSLHARQSYPARVPYASSKAAVCAMARSLALEWGSMGLRINTLLPWQVSGLRSTALANMAAAQGEDLLEAYRQRVPTRRMITPEEVAQAVRFLAENPGMNGAELVLDGGVSASMWYKPFLENA